MSGYMGKSPRDLDDEKNVDAFFGSRRSLHHDDQADDEARKLLDESERNHRDNELQAHRARLAERQSG
jgi:hypothetical protein